MRDAACPLSTRGGARRRTDAELAADWDAVKTLVDFAAPADYDENGSKGDAAAWGAGAWEGVAAWAMKEHWRLLQARPLPGRRPRGLPLGFAGRGVSS